MDTFHEVHSSNYDFNPNGLSFHISGNLISLHRKCQNQASHACFSLYQSTADCVLADTPPEQQMDNHKKKTTQSQAPQMPGGSKEAKSKCLSHIWIISYLLCIFYMYIAFLIYKKVNFIHSISHLPASDLLSLWFQVWEMTFGWGLWWSVQLTITLKSFINTVVWVQGRHRVANGTVLIVECVTYYIIARAFKNSVFST